MHSIDNTYDFDEEPPEAFDDLPLEELGHLGEIYEDYHATNNQKRELRIDWNPYEEFSAAFLDKHYELVLLNIFHHIMAFLLFPADCSCKERCFCHGWRHKTILSLNTARYNRLCRVHEDSSFLHAIRALWSLPDEAAFRELYPTSYPLWAINNGLKKRETSGDFKIISQLVDTFLRLGQTYKVCMNTREVSFAEATDKIGDLPVNTKAPHLNDLKALRGEKAYRALFNRYKSVCHFIAALEFCKKEDPMWDSSWECLYPPREQVQRFITIAQWFRNSLLLLERRNVKGKVFLKGEALCPLPNWVQFQEIKLPIEPFKERVREIMATAQIIDPATKLPIKEGFACWPDSYIKEFLSEES